MKGRIIATILCVLMFLMLSANTVSAKEIRIDDSNDFDTQVGCINVNNPTPKKGVFCIDISEGTGTVQMGKFYTIEISFWYYASYNLRHLTFILQDSAETGNYLSVDFYLTNEKNLNVVIKDGLKSGDDDDSKTEPSRHGSRLDTWLKGEIRLLKTSKGSDGTTKWIDISFDDVVIFEKYVITESPGVLERYWNVVEVKGQGIDLYTDEIIITTGKSDSFGFTWMFITLSGVGIYAIIATKYDLWPLRKGGVIRTQLRRLK